MGRGKGVARSQIAEPKMHTQRFDDQALQILLKEYDALRDLFSQAETSAQNIFNFYLTLVSAIGGAVVVILQLTSAQGSPQSEIVISVLLLFVAIIGSVYLSSITGRYAHMARYAQGIDEIRKFLLRLTDTPKPRIYEKFLAVDQKASPTAAQRAIGWTIWLEPTGTYQMFVAAVNSLSLGAAAWLFLSALRVTQAATFQSILASLEPIRKLVDT